MKNRDRWENIRPLGQGGQGTVFLVRTPTRAADRDNNLQKLMKLSSLSFDRERAREFAEATFAYAREERMDELGALKQFRPRAAGPQAEEQARSRLRSEIAVLSQNRPGLLRLLDSDAGEGWMVTEYCPGGTLQDHPFEFAGNVTLALNAFRSVVGSVAQLHKDRIVHRDIKPSNIFFRADGRLTLGDLGIAYLPDLPERVTCTNESVGPHDYMPPWAETEERFETVDGSFDVYMLGKLLWCMVAGRLKLVREWHRQPQFNVALKFPESPDMHVIHSG